MAERSEFGPPDGGGIFHVRPGFMVYSEDWGMVNGPGRILLTLEAALLQRAKLVEYAEIEFRFIMEKAARLARQS